MGGPEVQLAERDGIRVLRRSRRRRAAAATVARLLASE